MLGYALVIGFLIYYCRYPGGIRNGKKRKREIEDFERKKEKTLDEQT